MSVFLERLEQQPLQKEIQELSKELEVALKQDLHSEQAVIIRRTKRILDRFQETLSKTDPELFTVSMLDNTNQHLTALREAIIACKESADWNVLLKSGDAVLQHLATFLPEVPPEGAEKNFREALDEYRESVDARLEESEKAIEQQLNAAANAKKQIEEQFAEVSGSIEESKKSIPNIQDALNQLEESRGEIEGQLNSIREEINQLTVCRTS